MATTTAPKARAARASKAATRARPPAKAPVTARAKAPVKTSAKAPAPATPTFPTAPAAPNMPAAASAVTVSAKPLAAVKPGKPVKTEKNDRVKKPKMVRDSFTIPKAEYQALDDLKQRAVKAGIGVKKSELLRAGIKALVAMDDQRFAAAIGAVPAIKTGRPAKD